MERDISSEVLRENRRTFSFWSSTSVPELESTFWIGAEAHDLFDLKRSHLGFMSAEYKARFLSSFLQKDMDLYGIIRLLDRWNLAHLRPGGGRGSETD